MDSYVGADTTLWTKDADKQAKQILDQLLFTLPSCHYVLNRHEIYRGSGFFQTRVKRSGKVGSLLLTAEVLYCAEKNTYAVQLGFANHWYHKAPVWIYDVVSQQTVQHALKKCEANL